MLGKIEGRKRRGLQEYKTSRKECIDPRKTQGQALSLYSGSTGSKILDYQRTNPRISDSEN